jgi:MerR family mercuric resistance operon transcriptional regulator
VEQPVTIGQLAKAAGVNVQTVRYYERIRLIPKPTTTSSGYRQYTKQDLSRLRFIRRAQELGFSLRDIHQLLTLRVDRNRGCSEVKYMAESVLATLNRRVEQLQQLAEALRELADQCRGRGPVGECPILDFIEGKEND